MSDGRRRRRVLSDDQSRPARFTPSHCQSLPDSTLTIIVPKFKFAARGPTCNLNDAQRLGNPTPGPAAVTGYRSAGRCRSRNYTVQALRCWTRKLSISLPQASRQCRSGSEFQKSGACRGEHPAVEHPAVGVRISCKPDRQNGYVACMSVMVHTHCKLLTPPVHFVYALRILCILLTPHVHFLYALCILRKHLHAVHAGSHRFAHSVHTL